MLDIFFFSLPWFNHDILDSLNKFLFFFLSGLFAFFYLVPAIAVIGCHIFEWYSMDTWMANWQERVCRDEELSQRWQIPCKQPGNSNPVKQEPDISITMLKYAAIHLTSAFIGTWIFVPKTIDSWKRWYYRRYDD